VQGGRVLAEMRHEMQKEVFRSMAQRLFTRLQSKRKRVIGERQLAILNALLEQDRVRFVTLRDRMEPMYRSLKHSGSAFIRDTISLEELGAASITQDDQGQVWFEARMEWPAEITESDFFEQMKNLPKAKSHPFLR